MKVICIHPRFGGLTSHHFNESMALTREFGRRGIQFRLLINAQASAQIVTELGARAVWDDPTFRTEWTFEERSRRFLHLMHVHVDGDLGAGDCVLITVSTQLEAHSLTQSLQEVPSGRKPWVVILIISDRWNRFGRKEYKRQAAEFHILRAALSRLSPHDANRLIFLTLTNLLAEELSDLLNTRVGVVPMPLEYGDASSYVSKRRPDGLPRVVMLGGTRREKGSHLIGKIIRTCRAYVPVEFLVHLANNTLSAGEARKLARIAAEPGVTVILEPMTMPEYFAALNSADIALFPYKIIPYRKRTSGVFAEAVAYGKPVVVPNGTWMAEQISAGHAAGRIISDLRPHSIARAIASCVTDLEFLRESALAKAAEWRRNFGVSVFVDVIEHQISLRSN